MNIIKYESNVAIAAPVIDNNGIKIILKTIFLSIRNILLSEKEINFYNLGKLRLGKVLSPHIKAKVAFKRKNREINGS